MNPANDCDESSSTIVSGAAAKAGGGTLEFVFSDVFTFNGYAIGRIETYQVNLS